MTLQPRTKKPTDVPALWLWDAFRWPCRVFSIYTQYTPCDEKLCTISRVFNFSKFFKVVFYSIFLCFYYFFLFCNIFFNTSIFFKYFSFWVISILSVQCYAFRKTFKLLYNFCLITSFLIFDRVGTIFNVYTLNSWWWKVLYHKSWN